jgi:hypothetical protein
MPEGLYYWRALELLEYLGSAHGTRLVDLAVEMGLGSCAEQYAETFIMEAIAGGHAVPRNAAPDHSQRAFSSLGLSARIDYRVFSRVTCRGWYIKSTSPKAYAAAAGQWSLTFYSDYVLDLQGMCSPHSVARSSAARADDRTRR